MAGGRYRSRSSFSSWCWRSLSDHRLGRKKPAEWADFRGVDYPSSRLCGRNCVQQLVGSGPLERKGVGVSVRSTAQDALYLLAAAAVGALLGTFVFSGWIGMETPAAILAPSRGAPLVSPGSSSPPDCSRTRPPCTTARRRGRSACRCRAYEFTYRYEPPSWEVYAEVYAAGQWWPPLRPSFRRIVSRLGVDVGLRYKSGRAQLGALLSSEFGPAVRVKGAWRPWSYSP